jgi:hypothetical protein
VLRRLREAEAGGDDASVSVDSGVACGLHAPQVLFEAVRLEKASWREPNSTE